MQKEKLNQDCCPGGTTPAVARLLNSSYAEDPKEVTNAVQEMFELLMITEPGNNKATRERAYMALTALREASEIMIALSNENVMS